MLLKDLLNLIDNTAKSNNLSKPYLVGGFPRDVFMKNLSKIDDLDITCGDDDIKVLSNKLLENLPETIMTTFSDGHSRILYDKFKLDFSSNFKIPNIKEILIKSKITAPTQMQEEIYSRDFTINTLLMPMDLSSVIDVTGLGINDITNKRIDTCLSPRITLAYDPKRIIRIVYLSAKLNFYPSERVIDWVRKNNKILSNVNEKYTKSKLLKSIKANPEITNKIIELLDIKSYIV